MSMAKHMLVRRVQEIFEPSEANLTSNRGVVSLFSTSDNYVSILDYVV